MAKFRGFAVGRLCSAYPRVSTENLYPTQHSTQQFELESARHYETQLLQHTGSSVAAAQSTRQAAAPSGSTFFQDPLAMQMSLAHLSSLLRKALRSMQGEESSDSSSSSDDETSDEDSPAISELDHLSQPVSGGLAPSASSKAAKSATSSNSRKSRFRRNRKDSKFDIGEGGYLRLLGDGLGKEDRALERETELERLQSENAELRELLGIARELPPDVPAQ